MFCPKCGVENAEGANFCRSCGGLLATSPTGAAVPVAKTSGLAIVAMVLGILSFCTFFLTAPLAFILGIISLVMIARSNGRLKGMGFAITGIVVPIVAVPFVGFMMGILMPALAKARIVAQRQICANNLKQLGAAMMQYAEDNNDQFPSADKWCDLLKPYCENEKLFVCPAARTGRCSYAINPDATPTSSGGTMLLFETQDGWNQSGGLEILTNENHHGEGSNVLFCDGHVEFIKAAEDDDSDNSD
jgi:prepilin-type processing-associated H-X9-DG protein